LFAKQSPLFCDPKAVVWRFTTWHKSLWYCVRMRMDVRVSRRTKVERQGVTL